jgi:dihydroorotate dehydrogenase (NAD+) catalytic subunit
LRPFKGVIDHAPTMIMMKAKLETNIGGLKIKNPIIVASGTFGYGEEFQKLYDIGRLGAIATKGLSLKPRTGNDMPRIVETPSGMLNSIGLQNVGIDAYLKDKVPFLRAHTATIIANIFGENHEAYVELAQKLSEGKGADAIELNVSCPNVSHGGIEFGIDEDLSARLVEDVKKVTAIPIMVKLSPHAPSIPKMAQALEQAGADSLSVINTLSGMELDIKTRKPVLNRVTGGLSGPAIRPIALRMVHEAVQAVKIPVIGIGGIMNVEDVLRFLIVGAKAVQIGTANFVDPYAAIHILENLEAYLKEEGIGDVNEIIGSLEL